MKNRDNVHVYGGDDSSVFSAPLGSKAPEGLALPTTPWTDWGWLGEDGVTLEQKIKSDRVNAHQGGALIRKVYSEFERTFSLQMMEENAISFGLINPGSKLTVADGVARSTLTDTPSPITQAFTIDEFEIAPNADGKHEQKRWIITRGTVDPSVKAEHKYGKVTIYEFEITPEGPVEFLTNIKGLVDGASA